MRGRRNRLLTATLNDELAGRLDARRDPNPLIAHWGTLRHVQTHLAVRGQEVGAALVRRARQLARQEMGLEQLHPAARAGMGLEEFYGRLGLTEIGRRPGALRPGPDEDHDEVLMYLSQP